MVERARAGIVYSGFGKEEVEWGSQPVDCDPSGGSNNPFTGGHISDVFITIYRNSKIAAMK